MHSKKNKLIEKINETLNEMRVWIQSEGGDVNFVSFKNGILTLIVSGHCVGCISFDSTYTYGIKTMLMQTYPEIRDVIFTITK